MNKAEQEVIYSNEHYRVEKIKREGTQDFLYGVINNQFNVTEIEVPVLIQALKAADEVSDALDAFWQSKSFDAKPVIATA